MSPLVVAGGTPRVVVSPVISAPSTVSPPMQTASLSLLTPSVSAVNYVTRWGVVSHWGLNDNAGAVALTDSVSGHTLSNNTGVTVTTGQVGTGAGQFTAASSRYLFRGDNALLSTGDIDFWMSAWVYLDSKPTNAPFIMAKGASSTGEYQLDYYHVPDRFRFSIRSSGGTFRTATANNLGSPSLSTWYLIVAGHDAANDLVFIMVNNGTRDTLATSGTAPSDLAGQLVIGSNGAGGQYWDGRIDEVIFGKNPPLGIDALYSEISTQLWNGGAGRPYPWT